jgi:TIR domain
VARPRKTKVFVSYSRHDEALVKPLAGLLGVAADDAVFLDVASLKPGDLWDEKIIGAVKEASVFVLCWCCQCEHSTFIAKEISAALSEKQKRLVPVLFCSTPLPPAMADRQWIDLRGQIVHDCLSPHTQEKKVPRDPSDKWIARVRPPAQWDSVESPPPPQPVRMDQTPPPAPARSRPAGIPTVRKSRSSWFAYALLVILLAAGLGTLVYYFGAAPSARPQHPVQAAHASYLPLIILAIVALVFVSCAVFLLKKAIRFIRERRERRQTEEIAATASSYFKNLGKS